jgi:hypothetical protein
MTQYHSKDQRKQQQQKQQEEDQQEEQQKKGPLKHPALYHSSPTTNQCLALPSNTAQFNLKQTIQLQNQQQNISSRTQRDSALRYLHSLKFHFLFANTFFYSLKCFCILLLTLWSAPIQNKTFTYFSFIQSALQYEYHDKSFYACCHRCCYSLVVVLAQSKDLSP